MWKARSGMGFIRFQRRPHFFGPVIGGFFAVVSFLFALSGRLAEGRERDEMYRVEEGNRRMEAAFVDARTSLPYFWKKFAHPATDESDFSVKVKVVDGEKVEYFWLGDMKYQDGTVTGVLDNDPQTVGNVKIGDPVKLKVAEVYDWCYNSGGKLHGNYTLRAALPDFPEQERAVWEKLLAPRPSAQLLKP